MRDGPPVPRHAVAVMLVRDGRVLLGRRSPSLRAFPGLWAFPGGVLDPADHSTPVSGASDPEAAARIVAGAREAFEETGVLLARGRLPSRERLRDLRGRLLAGALDFRTLLEDHGLELDAGDFAEAASLVTPESAPFRFDTLFLRAALPETAGFELADPGATGGEMTDLRLIEPTEALHQWREGEMLLAPPIIGLLERWDPDPAAMRARNRVAVDRVDPEIRYSPGIRVIPCRTDTLPPARHTNAVLLGGEFRLLVDPAPTDPEEQKRLFDQVESSLAEGASASGSTLAGVVLTHHHPDHVGAAGEAARRFGAPVLAHRETLARLPDLAAVARPIGEGDVLDLGTAPDGTTGWAARVLHVPGHAPGHVALIENRYGALVAGDMVSSLSSILIPPEDDGDLAAYMKSLRRLAAETEGVTYPGHGAPVADGRALLEKQIRHREAREASLVAALSGRPRSEPDLCLAVYPASEVPASGRMRDLAGRALRSGLRKLEAEARAARATGPDGVGRWTAA